MVHPYLLLNPRRQYKSSRWLSCISRTIKEQYVYLESCISICKSITADLPQQVLIKHASIYAHKVITTKQPQAIFETIRFLTHRKLCQELTSKISARTRKRKRCLVHQIPKLYNNIPDKIKYLNHKKFKGKICKLHMAKAEVD